MARSDYQNFVNSGGKMIALCGRKKQALQFLIGNRRRGKGTVKNTVTWNLADTVRTLADDFGVVIGVRVLRFRDPNTVTGRGTVTHYFLLEEWVAMPSVEITKDEAEAVQVPDIRPHLRGAVAPFLETGSIGAAFQVELLNPLKMRAA